MGGDRQYAFLAVAGPWRPASEGPLSSEGLYGALGGRTRDVRAGQRAFGADAALTNRGLKSLHATPGIVLPTVRSGTRRTCAQRTRPCALPSQWFGCARQDLGSC
jgi:hypothetical protein